MPISLRPDRGDVPQIGDAAFDALLARALRPEEAMASLRPVVEGFTALYAAPVYSGPAAEASAMTTFRAWAVSGLGPAAVGPDLGPAAVGLGRGPAAVGLGRGPAAVGLGGGPAGARPGRGPTAVGPGRRARRGVRQAGPGAQSRLPRVRLGVAAAAVALAVGGAAAYTGDLPGPIQRVAHTVIGAPSATQGAPRPAPGHSAAPPIPGNEAYGLCRAYERAVATGHPAHNPVTFQRLAEAVGGASRVAAYCAQVLHPGNPASTHPTHPQHGKPSDLPTQHGNPTPASSHHGKPSVLPTPAATQHGKSTR